MGASKAKEHDKDQAMTPMPTRLPTLPVPPPNRESDTAHHSGNTSPTKMKSKYGSTAEAPSPHTTMASLPLGYRLFCGRNGTRSPDSSYKWVVLFLTFIFYTTYHLSRKPISVVKPELHPNCTGVPNCTSWAPFDKDNYKELLGSLDYAFLVPYAIGMFISGHVAERMDLRYFLTFGMITSGITTALFGFGKYWNIHALSYYIVIQVITGLLSSTGWPAVVSCVANWFGKGRRGLIMGIWNCHTSVGNILGSVIAGIFVSYNWGLSFIVPGIIIASAGVICFLFLVPKPDIEEPPKTDYTGILESNHSGTALSLDMDEDEEADAPLIAHQEQQAITFFSALKIPGVIEFSLCLFFSKLVSYTFLFWLPTYISNTSKVDAQRAADLSTAFDFGGAAGGILAGLVSDYIGGRATVCAVMLAAATPMMFIYESYGSMHGLAVNVVMLLLVGMLVNGPYALITTAVSADLGTHPSLMGSARALATVTAIIDGTGSMGAALGPLLTGIISKSGWQNVFFMLIAADGCALLLLARLVWKEFVMWRTPSSPFDVQQTETSNSDSA